MALLAAIKAIGQSADESDPHVLGFATARAGADALLLDVWNAATSAGRVAAIGQDGHFYSAVPAAGGLLYGVTGGVTGVRRLDALVIGTAGQALKVNAGATAPEWGTLGVPGGGTGLTTLSAAGALLYSTAATTLAALAVGTANQLLRVNAGATAPEWASTLSGLTLTTPTINGAALSGTLTGTPTWGSAQAITLSTAAQTNVTSLGTLTGLTVSPGPIAITGAAGEQRRLDLKTAGVSRWGIIAENDAESGGDAGSNLVIQRFTDAGVFIADALTIVRATGVVSVTGLVTASGGLTVASGQTLTVTGATVTGLTAASVGAGTFPGAVTAGAGLTVTSGQTLTVTGVTVTGLTAASVAAGTFPAGSFSIPTLAVTSGLTLTGATITGTPTWSSAQAITLSTAAQPSVTSLGSLTALTIDAAAPTMIVTKTASGQNCLIEGKTGSARRWDLIIGDNTAESGSDAGSELSIRKFDDAGADNGLAFQIRRSDGRIQIPNLAGTGSRAVVADASGNLSAT